MNKLVIFSPGWNRGTHCADEWEIKFIKNIEDKDKYILKYINFSPWRPQNPALNLASSHIKIAKKEILKIIDSYSYIENITFVTVSLGAMSLFYLINNSKPFAKKLKNKNINIIFVSPVVNSFIKSGYFSNSLKTVDGFSKKNAIKFKKDYYKYSNIDLNINNTLNASFYSVSLIIGDKDFKIFKEEAENISKINGYNLTWIKDADHGNLEFVNEEWIINRKLIKLIKNII